MELTDLIATLHAGDLNREAGEELAEVVRAVMATGKKGSFSLTINIKRTGLQKCVIDTDIRSKPPKEDYPIQAMFATTEGDLQSENPNQATLNFKDAKADTREPKEVEAEIIEPKVAGE